MILSQLLAFLISVSFAIDPDCNYYESMEPSLSYYAYNSEYPENYESSKNCRWIVVAPVDLKIDINCSIDLPLTADCSQDRVLISLTGNPNLEHANTYCGSETITLQTEGNKVSIGLETAYNTTGGKFLCTIVAKPIPCDCGWTQTTRIVGGVGTNVNEFPMMAALVDSVNKELFCGATIIAKQYAITAAHCVQNYDAFKIGLVVGEHDLTTGTETNATRVYRIAKYILHYLYNPNDVKSANDIALVKTAISIQFSMDVGPACLPIRFAEDSFAEATVEALGWGKTKLGGPKSNVLLKTNLSVLSEIDCFNQVQGSPSQMCTYRDGYDPCESDAGGPLLWHTTTNSRLYVLGVISYGICGASSVLGINTRVTSFIPWIMSNTPDVEYCVK